MLWMMKALGHLGLDHCFLEGQHFHFGQNHCLGQDHFHLKVKKNKTPGNASIVCFTHLFQFQNVVEMTLYCDLKIKHHMLFCKSTF